MDIEWVSVRTKQLAQVIYSEHVCTLYVARRGERGQAMVRISLGGRIVWILRVNCVGREVVLVCRNEETGVITSETIYGDDEETLERGILGFLTTMDA